MNADDFSTFYENIHKRGPFPWQQRLAKQVIETRAWPKLLSLPTASGKTSVIDIAVFALALQANEGPGQRTAAVRTFFVIDRRLVVDDVYNHAKKLQESLAQPDNALLREVRERLCNFGGHLPLEVTALRGGMYRSDTWADEPNQPLVCVTTVDQIGSRLLFRGYGVSEERRPIHAGLAGVDSLIIVDEAHLSKPFLDTVRSVRMFQGEQWRDSKEQCGIALDVVEMSATPRAHAQPFALDHEDYSDEVLSRRLTAQKIAVLEETSNLVDHASSEALRMVSESDVKVVGVVVNTVGSARAIFEELRTKEEVLLLTGRTRPYERDHLCMKYIERIKAGRSSHHEDPLIVVATQTIEVGADLDFDALITEAAPLDSLRQRFGRLNRLGRPFEAKALILKPKRNKATEHIYGDALERTWDWLVRHSHQDSGKAVIDFGAVAMSRVFEQNGSEHLNCISEQGPVLLPALLDTWVQTNPTPEPDPEVAPFLHGREALLSADVQIVWRADLAGNPEQWVEIVGEAPPSLREALPLSFRAAIRWLRGETVDLADTEGLGADEQTGIFNGSNYLVWRGPRKTDAERKSFWPGDTIVVPSSRGGADEYGWHPESGRPVTDIGDLCANERASHGIGKYRIRVHPDVLFSRESHAQQNLRMTELLGRNGEEEQLTNLEEIVELVKERATEYAANHQPYLKDAVEYFSVNSLKEYGSPKGWLWVDRVKRKPQVTQSEQDDADEGDEESLRESGIPVTLMEHTDGVKALVQRYASHCGLAPQLVDDLVLAAELHDLGKCDERFQFLLDPDRRPDDKPNAKGLGQRSVSEYKYRLQLSGYPERSRHEFASVTLAKTSKLLQRAHDRELVLHLVGTHHGYGRSLAPFWSEKEPDYPLQVDVDGEEFVGRAGDASRIARIDSGWTQQFWSLVRRYGYWHLAYLEAILRRADCVRSRKEENEQDRTMRAAS